MVGIGNSVYVTPLLLCMEAPNRLVEIFLNWAQWCFAVLSCIII